MLNTMQANIEKINALITNLQLPQKVNIIAVTKTLNVADIEEAIKCGLTDFAENYVAEANTKWPSLKERYPFVKLHLIGHLQSNKVKTALQLFDVIHTLDSTKLAEKIAQDGSYKSKQYFIQVNLNPQETNKNGISVTNLPALVTICKNLNFNLLGLMGVASVLEAPENYFLKLSQLNKSYGFFNLSAGMSADYLVALKNGANYIRLGTIIFGERNKSNNIQDLKNNGK